MRVKTDAKRRAILKEARRLFLKDGYEAASTARIAAAANASKATIYSYFRSKEALFKAVVRDACEEQAESSLAALETPGPLREVLLELARRYLRFVLAPEALSILRIMPAEAVRSPALARSFYDQGPGQAQTRVAGMLHRFMEEGELCVADPLLLASQFQQLCQAGLFERRFWNLIDHVSDLEIDQSAEFAVETFLRAHGRTEPA